LKVGIGVGVISLFALAFWVARRNGSSTAS
jgi:hypothetical protein